MQHELNRAPIPHPGFEVVFFFGFIEISKRICYAKRRNSRFKFLEDNNIVIHAYLFHFTHGHFSLQHRLVLEEPSTSCCQGAR